LEFIKRLQSSNDLGDVVIVGDLVDLWRRDVIALGFELSTCVEELKILQENAEVHYIFGNHDFLILMNSCKTNLNAYTRDRCAQSRNSWWCGQVTTQW
jgi:UDP-2,3-diacylglucosamine pyrophosphatase LpxH